MTLYTGNYRELRDLRPGDTVIGDYNRLFGDGFFVTGDYCEIHGDRVRVDGDYCYVYGEGCEVRGDYNELKGSGNMLGDFNKQHPGVRFVERERPLPARLQSEVRPASWTPYWSLGGQSLMRPGFGDLQGAVNISMRAGYVAPAPVPAPAPAPSPIYPPVPHHDPELDDATFDSLPADSRCAICLARASCTAAGPCGHVYACATCASQKPSECAICRTPITTMLLLHKS